ncbi:hypothetical protein FIBSPDRAFT_1053469 [Athelia psychrophila]|uniref:Uncharacterized protein n=1 Tax=Athelia psychrophila TaxID=1759441 RepID=A0A167WXY5_9AGAM|nr:hypothetical protein FIBSPDRAFT_1053469 [Fibularhizoctonia sp. CBS 109695]
MLGYRRREFGPKSRTIPFPENSSGFLYLSSTTDKPQSAWEIRFRVTDGNAPQSFKSGVDLLSPDHKPWYIPLRKLGRKKYAALRELLLRDGLVDDSLFHLRPYNVKQHIQTLDPSRLQPSDHLNLSASSKSNIYNQESAFKVIYTHINKCLVPFPDDARGFLYLHSPAAKPMAMWDIRFRVTDNNLPSSFKSGSDLLYPNGTTWAISLGSLQAHNPQYLALRDLLIREGFDVGALLSKIGFTKKKMAKSSPLIESSLDQRFRVDFQGATTVIFISLNERLRCAFRPMSQKLNPHSGSAWCRFETHSSPGSAQPDQLAIRVLEMITPVTVSKPELAHRVPMPREGELVMRILISTQESPFYVAYTSLKRRHVHFPDDACGFLYLHSPAAEPKAMWEIRFRVTDNNCPSSFKSGSDLLFPNLTPWAISLGSLQARHPEYLPLRDLLIREGLDIDALLEKMGATRPKKSTSSPLIDYSLTQRFRVDFDRTIIIVNFISFGGEQLRCAIQHVFDADEPRLKPYSGSAWCRFEAHSSPGSTQPDQLAIRILEMIVPVTVSKPDIAHRVPMPQEGQLIMRYTKRGPGNHQPQTLDLRPWTLNAERTAHPVIQSILRDAAT